MYDECRNDRFTKRASETEVSKKNEKKTSKNLIKIREIERIRKK